MRQMDQVYASPSGVPIRFDLLKPDTDEPLPLVVCLHGGGWISGDKSDMHEVVELLASEGFAAACPDYRLAPLYPFPAAVEDVMTFVRHARANAKELGIAPDRIASMGNSAGGHLASMLGVLDRFPSESPDVPSSRVQAVVNICGISDVSDPHANHLPIAWSFLEQFMETPYEGNEGRYRLASPVAHVDANASPFFIAHGEEDDIVPIQQSERLAEALRQHAVPFEMIRYPGEGHSFGYASWPDIVRRSIAFLKETLGAVQVVKA